jgi:hypothetical protein
MHLRVSYVTIEFHVISFILLLKRGGGIVVLNAQ